MPWWSWVKEVQNTNPNTMETKVPVSVYEHDHQELQWKFVDVKTLLSKWDNFKSYVPYIAQRKQSWLLELEVGDLFDNFEYPDDLKWLTEEQLNDPAYQQKLPKVTIKTKDWDKVYSLIFIWEWPITDKLWVTRKWLIRHTKFQSYILADFSKDENWKVKERVKVETTNTIRPAWKWNWFLNKNPDKLFYENNTAITIVDDEWKPALSSNRVLSFTAMEERVAWIWKNERWYLSTTLQLERLWEHDQQLALDGNRVFMNTSANQWKSKWYLFNFETNKEEEVEYDARPIFTTSDIIFNDDNKAIVIWWKTIDISDRNYSEPFDIRWKNLDYNTLQSRFNMLWEKWKTMNPTWYTEDNSTKPVTEKSIKEKEEKAVVNNPNAKPMKQAKKEFKAIVKAQNDNVNMVVEQANNTTAEPTESVEETILKNTESFKAWWVQEWLFWWPSLDSIKSSVENKLKAIINISLKEKEINDRLDEVNDLIKEIEDQDEIDQDDLDSLNSERIDLEDQLETLYKIQEIVNESDDFESVEEYISSELERLKEWDTNTVMDMASEYWILEWVSNTSETTPQQQTVEQTPQQQTVAPTPVTKIISWWQSWADRLWLEIAKELWIETWWTAPKWYRTEANTEEWQKANVEALKSFWLIEDESSDYKSRTRKNVDNSDWTIILASNVDSPWTKLTINYAKQQWKPIFIINDKTSSNDIRQWLNDNNIQTLNVAGNRASTDKKWTIYWYWEKLKEALSDKVNIQDNNISDASTTSDNTTESNEWSEEQLPNTLVDNSQTTWQKWWTWPLNLSNEEIKSIDQRKLKIYSRTLNPNGKTTLNTVALSSLWKKKWDNWRPVVVPKREKAWKLYGNYEVLNKDWTIRLYQSRYWYYLSKKVWDKFERVSYVYSDTKSLIDLLNMSQAELNIIAWIDEESVPLPEDLLALEYIPNEEVWKNLLSDKWTVDQLAKDCRDLWITLASLDAQSLWTIIYAYSQWLWMDYVLEEFAKKIPSSQVDWQIVRLLQKVWVLEKAWKYDNLTLSEIVAYNYWLKQIKKWNINVICANMWVALNDLTPDQSNAIYNAITNYYISRYLNLDPSAYKYNSPLKRKIRKIVKDKLLESDIFVHEPGNESLTYWEDPDMLLKLEKMPNKVLKNFAYAAYNYKTPDWESMPLIDNTTYNYLMESNPNLTIIWNDDYEVWPFWSAVLESINGITEIWEVKWSNKEKIQLVFDIYSYYSWSRKATYEWLVEYLKKKYQWKWRRAMNELINILADDAKKIWVLYHSDWVMMSLRSTWVEWYDNDPYQKFIKWKNKDAVIDALTILEANDSDSFQQLMIYAPKEIKDELYKKFYDENKNERSSNIAYRIVSWLLQNNVKVAASLKRENNKNLPDIKWDVEDILKAFNPMSLVTSDTTRILRERFWLKRLDINKWTVILTNNRQDSLGKWMTNFNDCERFPLLPISSLNEIKADVNVIVPYWVSIPSDTNWQNFNIIRLDGAWYNDWALVVNKQWNKIKDFNKRTYNIFWAYWIWIRYVDWFILTDDQKEIIKSAHNTKSLYWNIFKNNILPNLSEENKNITQEEFEQAITLKWMNNVPLDMLYKCFAAWDLQEIINNSVAIINMVTRSKFSLKTKIKVNKSSLNTNKSISDFVEFINKCVLSNASKERMINMYTDFVLTQMAIWKINLAKWYDRFTRVHDQALKEFYNLPDVKAMTVKWIELDQMFLNINSTEVEPVKLSNDELLNYKIDRDSALRPLFKKARLKNKEIEKLEKDYNDLKKKYKIEVKSEWNEEMKERVMKKLEEEKRLKKEIEKVSLEYSALVLKYQSNKNIDQDPSNRKEAWKKVYSDRRIKKKISQREKLSKQLDDLRNDNSIDYNEQSLELRIRLDIAEKELQELKSKYSDTRTEEQKKEIKDKQDESSKLHNEYYALIRSNASKEKIQQKISQIKNVDLEIRELNRKYRNNATSEWKRLISEKETTISNLNSKLNNVMNKLKDMMPSIPQEQKDELADAYNKVLSARKDLILIESEIDDIEWKHKPDFIKITNEESWATQEKDENYVENSTLLWSNAEDVNKIFSNKSMKVLEVLFHNFIENNAITTESQTDPNSNNNVVSQELISFISWEDVFSNVYSDAEIWKERDKYYDYGRKDLFQLISILTTLKATNPARFKSFLDEIFRTYEDLWYTYDTSSHQKLLKYKDQVAANPWSLYDIFPKIWTDERYNIEFLKWWKIEKKLNYQDVTAEALLQNSSKEYFEWSPYIMRTWNWVENMNKNVEQYHKLYDKYFEWLLPKWVLPADEQVKAFAKMKDAFDNRKTSWSNTDKNKVFAIPGIAWTWKTTMLSAFFKYVSEQWWSAYEVDNIANWKQKSLIYNFPWDDHNLFKKSTNNQKFAVKVSSKDWWWWDVWIEFEWWSNLINHDKLLKMPVKWYTDNNWNKIKWVLDWYNWLFEWEQAANALAERWKWYEKSYKRKDWTIWNWSATVRKIDEFKVVNAPSKWSIVLKWNDLKSDKQKNCILWYTDSISPSEDKWQSFDNVYVNKSLSDIHFAVRMHQTVSSLKATFSEWNSFRWIDYWTEWSYMTQNNPSVMNLFWYWDNPVVKRQMKWQVIIIDEAQNSYNSDLKAIAEQLWWDNVVIMLWDFHQNSKWDYFENLSKDEQYMVETHRWTPDINMMNEINAFTQNALIKANAIWYYMTDSDDFRRYEWLNKEWFKAKPNEYLMVVRTNDTRQEVNDQYLESLWWTITKNQKWETESTNLDELIKNWTKLQVMVVTTFSNQKLNRRWRKSEMPNEWLSMDGFKSADNWKYYWREKDWKLQVFFPSTNTSNDNDNYIKEFNSRFRWYAEKWKDVEVFVPAFAITTEKESWKTVDNIILHDEVVNVDYDHLSEQNTKIYYDAFTRWAKKVYIPQRCPRLVWITREDAQNLMNWIPLKAWYIERTEDKTTIDKFTLPVITTKRSWWMDIVDDIDYLLWLIWWTWRKKLSNLYSAIYALKTYNMWEQTYWDREAYWDTESEEYINVLKKHVADQWDSNKDLIIKLLQWQALPEWISDLIEKIDRIIYWVEYKVPLLSVNGDWSYLNWKEWTEDYRIWWDTKFRNKIVTLTDFMNWWKNVAKWALTNWTLYRPELLFENWKRVMKLVPVEKDNWKRVTLSTRWWIDKSTKDYNINIMHDAIDMQIERIFNYQFDNDVISPEWFRMQDYKSVATREWEDMNISYNLIDTIRQWQWNLKKWTIFEPLDMTNYTEEQRDEVVERFWVELQKFIENITSDLSESDLYKINEMYKDKEPAGAEQLPADVVFDIKYDKTAIKQKYDSIMAQIAQKDLRNLKSLKSEIKEFANRVISIDQWETSIWYDEQEYNSFIWDFNVYMNEAWMFDWIEDCNNCEA